MSSEGDLEEAPLQWPVVIALAHPVEFAGEHITSLEFRRGRMGDLKGMKLDDVPPFDHLLLLASRMCGRSIKVLEMLDADDGAEVVRIALGFFVRSLGVGKKR